MAGERESTTQAAIRQAVCQLGWARLLRNNTGRVRAEDGQYHVFGLGKGGADLVGVVVMENGLGRAFAIEIKRPQGGRTSPEQVAWLTAFNKLGGAGAVCRDRVTAIEFAHRARTGELFTGPGPYKV